MEEEKKIEPMAFPKLKYIHIQGRLEMNSKCLEKDKKRPKKDSKLRKQKKHFGPIQKL